MPEDLSTFYNRHYILLDTTDNIIDGWSDGPFPDKDISQAICVNEQGGYQFRLFPDGEENPPLFDIDGTPLYKYEDKQIRELNAIEKHIYKTKQENKNLPSIKSQLIVESKNQLAQFLAHHPLIWSDSKAYSVTQEKQALLTEQLGLYTIDQSMPLYWNASGEECQQWEITKLASLAKAIASYVRPYVRYQYQKEKEIQLAETAEEARAIKVDYSEISG